MAKVFVHFLKNETGASSIEYGMLAFGVAVAIVVAVLAVGTELTNSYTSVDTAMK
jgi:pilus assembly protein Flp/PilA